MQEVRAYQDEAGRLHKTQREAIVSDFILKVGKVWNALPSLRDRGDPAIIATALASPNSYDARVALMDALNELDGYLAKIGD